MVWFEEIVIFEEVEKEEGSCGCEAGLLSL